MLSGPEHGGGDRRRAADARRVIASEDAALAEELQRAINSIVFRVYVNPTSLGVELCAAAKNVIALAAGGVDGLGLGDNGEGGADHAQASAEMARLGRRCGAGRRRSPASRGMGDLIVTCWHATGRNRRATATMISRRR